MPRFSRTRGARAVPRRRSVLPVAAALLLAACSQSGAEPRAPAAPVPAEAEQPPALALGKESMYRVLNIGSLDTADKLLDNVWSLPRHPAVKLQVPLTWTEDPFRESYWRFIFYGLRPTSDLLWAYYTTDDVRYRDKLLEILRSYVAFDSTQRPLDRKRLDNRHTSAFRAMVLLNAHAKLKRSEDLPADLEGGLVQAILRLGRFLADPENFEGDQNHGFAEVAALLLVAEQFPDAPGAARWHEIATGRLDSLIDKTVDADGVEVENSPFYHFYVLSSLLEISAWAEANSVPLSPKTDRAVDKMVRYATYITLPDGQIPLLGASVTLDVRRNRPDLYPQLAREFPEFEFVRSGGTAGRPLERRSVMFPASGHAILTSGARNAAELAAQTHVVLDAGAYRTSHSHLDGLSLNYHSAGRTLLPDSGLFTYEEETAEFAYFHGTRSHNTVTVDGADQLEGTVAQGPLHDEDEFSAQSGVHTLYPGVTHRRSVILLRRDLVLVVDRLGSDTEHDYAQTWHLFPGAKLERPGGLRAVATDGGRPQLAIDQALTDGVELSVHTGERDPLYGWHSANYNRMVPATALEYRAQGSAAAFVTLISSGPYAGGARSLDAEVDGETVQARVCTGDAALSVRVDGQARSDEQIEVTADPAACAG
jgi:hypothetical protein